MKTFVTRIYEKLEVRTRLDLLSLAIERAGSRTATVPRGSKKCLVRFPA